MRTFPARLLGVCVIPFMAALVVPFPAARPSPTVDKATIHTSEVEIKSIILAAPASATPTPAPPAPPARRIAARPARASRSRTSRAAPARPIRFGEVRSTIASWYNDRPSRCHDRAGTHPVPRTQLWTAHRTLRCGTIVEVRGPAGVVRVPVYDQGPYVHGRDLDLSASAFRRTCGSTSRGICRVTYAIAA